MRKKPAGRLCLGLFALGFFVAIPDAAPGSGSQGVTFTRTELTIPTYLVGEPDRNPMFYFGRAYQGARGPVYPYAFLDNLTERRADKVYTALYLENEYVRFCVLPEIGGRIFEAVDKTDGYDFFYRQHVIKPALVGMLGAWISGGVEWNIPHHHRATSFMPVDWAVSETPDGGRTIWVGETELRHRMRWSVGLTLRPGCSALEVSYRIYNGTPFSHSILCWANAAVHANENYQVIFPPGVRLATFHGKNEYSHWPISREVYNGVDYTRGVDVSWWKNHPRPTSFFAYDSDEDFLAGYDHGREAGVVFVGDHTVSPGKKLWTWGTGSEGARWEEILTDKDGPYLELMFGSFSDNQPDYSWIQPYELKTARQFWYPIRGVGGVQAANGEAACRLELGSTSRAAIGFLTTSVHQGAVVRLTADDADRERGGNVVPQALGRPAAPRREGGMADRLIFEKKLDVGPGRPFSEEIALPSGTKPESLRLSLVTAEGRELISYRPRRQAEASLPQPVAPPPAPDGIKTSEELYLAGLRLEQFHNPALEPEPYYLEVLKREPDDARANTALGRRDLLAGRFEQAEACLRRAAGRLAANETRPKDAEPLFYLGVALRFQRREREAYEAFGRASWDRAWSAASWFEMAGLAVGWGDTVRGLQLVGQSLAADGRNGKAADLKSSLLRRTGRLAEAEALARATLSADPLDFWAANELALVLSAMGEAAEAGRRTDGLRDAMRDAAQNYLEVAADYARCGLLEEAAGVLSGFAAAKDSPTVDPLVYYDLAFYSHKLGREAEVGRCLERAGLAPPDYCFPFRLESIEVLGWAERRNPRDARAPYYLGNLFFDRQPERAIEEWEKSKALEGTPAMVERNLGLAYSRVRNDIPRAVRSLERAVARNPDDPRLYFELDELYDLAGESAAKRLSVLARHQAVVARRDDSLSREIDLLIELGRYDRALELLAGHRFHVWEGGGGVHDMFVDAHLLRGQALLSRSRAEPALEDFRAALAYPENLEVARPDSGGRDPEIDYWIGTALDAASDRRRAKEMFERSANSNAPPGELLYYQGLSCRKLGRGEEAAAAFDRLVNWSRAGLDGQPAMDYFAKFGGRESAERREAGFRYLLGLGLLGQGQRAEARREFERALTLYPGLARARRQLDRIIHERIS
jgi:tetratricopeptide (TPR) repeat protein